MKEAHRAFTSNMRIGFLTPPHAFATIICFRVLQIRLLLTYSIFIFCLVQVEFDCVIQNSLISHPPFPLHFFGKNPIYFIGCWI